MIGKTTGVPSGANSGILEGSVKGGIIVRNLPPKARSQDIKDLFSRSGTVLGAKIMLDPETNRSLEWAAVQFDTAAQAKRAVEQFNGYFWQSRVLEVEVNQGFLLFDYADTDRDSVESGIGHLETSSLDWTNDLEDDRAKTPTQVEGSWGRDKNPFRSPSLLSAEPGSLSSPRASSTELRPRWPDAPSQSNILPNASQVVLEGNNTLDSAGRNIYNINPSVTLSVQTDPSQSISPISSIMASSTPTIMNNSTSPSFDFLVGEGEHDSETYARLLLPKKHGWPLWLPRPPRNLPEEYRKRGIDIGDVGIVTTTGEFDFSFNICLPANDPINRNSVPDNFEPISHPDNSDVSFDPEEWMPGDYVVTSSVSEQASIRAIDDSTRQPPHYQFIASSPAGALLLMPRGGSRRDLLNTAPFIAYAKKHGPNWYKHINGTRGRGAANGSVYLITGVDKTQVWGTGVYSRLARDVIPNPLTFRQADTVDNGSNYEYVWMRPQSGFATTKYGPLKEFFDGSSELPYNQCTFLRGFRVALNESLWSSLIRGGVEVSPIENISPDSLLQKDHDSYSPRSGFSALSSYFGFSGGGYSGTSTTRTTGSASEVTLHPSDIINCYLLQENKHAEVAVTHDSVWCAVVDEDATVLPNFGNMLSRIKEKYQPVYSDGGISFEPKDTKNADPSQSSEVPHSKRPPKETTGTSSSVDSSWGSGESESTSKYSNLYRHSHLSTSTFPESTSDLNSISDRRTLWSYISGDRASTAETITGSSEELKESPTTELRLRNLPAKPLSSLSSGKKKSLAKRIFSTSRLGRSKGPNTALSASPLSRPPDTEQNAMTDVVSPEERREVRDESIPTTSDFWIPQVTKNGQVYYVNAPTGEGSWHLRSPPEDWGNNLFRQELGIAGGSNTQAPAVSSVQKTEDHPAEIASVGFLAPDYNPLEIVLDSDKSVRGGTLTALVEKLTTHEQIDPTFVDVFLTTYKSFTTVDELLDHLIARFQLQPPPNLEPSQLEVWTERKQRIVQSRVFSVLGFIITDRNIFEKEDYHTFARIEEFVRPLAEDHEDAGKLLLTIDQITRFEDGHFDDQKASRTEAPPPVIPKKVGDLKFSDIDPLELARQLTILENDLYTASRSIDWLNRALKQKKEDMDSIARQIRSSNQIADWVADMVLSREDPRKRAAVIKQFIAVANCCREIQNFSSMVALTSALNAPAIRRLKRSWELVNRRIMGQLEACEKTIENQQTFTRYKQAVASLTPPVIPFAGIFLSSLSSIQDGTPDKLPDDLINFRKRQKFYEIISEINRWQRQSYNFQPVPSIQQFLETSLSKFMDFRESSERFWYLSLEREPRERDETQRTWSKILSDSISFNPMAGKATDTSSGSCSNSKTPKGSMKGGLVVRNLPPEAHAHDIRDLFSLSGTVVSARVMRNPQTKMSLEWGTVQLDTLAQTQRAIERFDGYCWLSRILEVEANQGSAWSDYDTDEDSPECGVARRETSSLDWTADLEDEASTTLRQADGSLGRDEGSFKSLAGSAGHGASKSPRTLSTELPSRYDDPPSQSNIFPNTSGIVLEGNNNLSSVGRNVYHIKPSLTFSVQTDSSQLINSNSSDTPSAASAFPTSMSCSIPPTSATRGKKCEHDSKKLRSDEKSPDSSPSMSSSSSIMVSSAPTNMNNSNSPSFDFLVREGEHVSETYARLLLPKKYGWPLWLPRPLRNLPEAYRKRGIDIGDVGIITTTGEFDFFFNICLPANDPINRNSVPDNFEPICHPDNLDVSSEPEEWMPGDYVVTSSLSEHASIRAIDDSTRQSPDYQFIVSAPAGALLLMPRGGSRRDLLNIAPFIAYAKKHGPNWYKHINGTKGRRAANGSVYLITGVDKTQVWGTGVYSRLARDVNPNPLTFRQADTVDSSSKYEYVWVRPQSGFATTKYGPLKEFFDGSSELPYNQCTFLRGFRVALNESLWSSLMGGGVEVSPIQNISPDSLLQQSNDSYSPRSGFSALSSYFGFSGGGYSGTGTTRTTGSASEGVGEPVTVISEIPASSMTLHPSDIINCHLLQENKHAEVAVTHDSVWCAVVDEDATALPTFGNMLSRIKEKYQPVYSDGGISFEPKDTNNDASHLTNGTDDKLFEDNQSKVQFPCIFTTSEDKYDRRATLVTLSSESRVRRAPYSATGPSHSTNGITFSRFAPSILRQTLSTSSKASSSLHILSTEPSPDQPSSVAPTEAWRSPLLEPIWAPDMLIEMQDRNGVSIPGALWQGIFRCYWDGCGLIVERILCKSYLEYLRNVFAHLSDHVGDKDQPFCCKWKGCTFECHAAKDKLQRDRVQHVLTHTERWFYLCVMCGKTYRRKDTRSQRHNCRRRPDLCALKECSKMTLAEFWTLCPRGRDDKVQFSPVLDHFFKDQDQDQDHVFFAGPFFQSGSV